MKRVLSTMAIAAFGGLISIGVYKMVEPAPDRMEQVRTDSANDARQVSYDGIVPDMSVNFATAAEMTVNAVVHVKTESI